MPMITNNTFISRGKALELLKAALKQHQLLNGWTRPTPTGIGLAWSTLMNIRRAPQSQAKGGPSSQALASQSGSPDAFLHSHFQCGQTGSGLCPETSIESVLGEEDTATWHEKSTRQSVTDAPVKLLGVRRSRESVQLLQCHPPWQDD